MSSGNLKRQKASGFDDIADDKTNYFNVKVTIFRYKIFHSENRKFTL